MGKRPDKEFEFEFEDDVKGDKPKRIKKPKEAKPIPEKATKMPISNGIKRRLMKDMREIKKLKEEILDYKSEKNDIERELEGLEDELSNLRAEREKLQDDINHKIAIATALEKKLNRTQKDFESYKKRIQEEIDRKAKLTQKKVLMGVIDIIDNLDRAIDNKGMDQKIRSNENHLIGLETIKKAAIKILDDNEIKMIDPIEVPFDPKFHEAIDVVQDTTVYDNTVIKVESKGYLLDKMVLRPAKVKVSKGGKSRPKIIKAIDNEIKKKKEKDGPEIKEKDDENLDENMPEDMEELEEMEDNTEKEIE